MVIRVTPFMGLTVRMAERPIGQPTRRAAGIMFVKDPKRWRGVLGSRGAKLENVLEGGFVQHAFPWTKIHKASKK
jgi:hypothetical protein